MKTLRQVLYLSRAQPGLGESDVRQILWISQRNNRRQDITGCLLCAGDRFAQVIEGEPRRLDELIARLHKDPRHSDFVVALDRQVTTRSFAQWSMGILYKLEVADLLASLASSATLSEDQALHVLSEMKPDSVMGSL
jgi:hypothetical protein